MEIVNKLIVVDLTSQFQEQKNLPSPDDKD